MNLYVITILSQLDVGSWSNVQWYVFRRWIVLMMLTYWAET